MLQNLINKFSTTIYVQIWENRIKVTDMSTGNIFDEKPVIAAEKTAKGKRVIAFGNKATMASGNNIELNNPFSHPRVLFSDFSVGVTLLKNIFTILCEKKIFVPSPKVVIHPMEKTEGGLTVIEERAFRELAMSAGAKDAIVYLGSQLSIHDFDFEAIKSTNKDSLVSDYLSTHWPNLVFWLLIIVIFAVQYGN